MHPDEMGFISALAVGDSRQATELLKRNPDWVEFCRDDFPFHAPLLQLAAQHGRLEIAQNLLSLHPELMNQLDFNGENCLSCACRYGHADFVQWILSLHGSQLLEKDEDDMGPIDYACQEGHLSIAKLLVEHDPACLVKGECDSVLFFAAESGNMELVNWLLERVSESEIVEKSVLGDHCWDRALAFGHEKISLFLLSQHLTLLDDRWDLNIAQLFDREFSVIPEHLALLRPYLTPEDFDLETEICEALLTAIGRADVPRLFETVLDLFPPPFDEEELFDDIELCSPEYEFNGRVHSVQRAASLTEDCEFPVFSQALESNNHEAIRYFWEHPQYAIDLAQFPKSAFEHATYHTPEVTAFLLCYVVDDLLVSRMRHLVEVHCESSNVEGLKMVVDGNLGDAITRLLGEIPDILKQPIERADRVRADQRMSISQCSLQRLSESNHGSKPVLEYLVTTFSEFFPQQWKATEVLENAVLRGSTEFCRFIFDRMPDADLFKEFSQSRELFSDSPATLTAKRGHIDLLRYLFERVPPEIVVGDGEPLYQASDRGWQEVVRLLLRYFPEKQIVPCRKKWGTEMAIMGWPLANACSSHFDFPLLKQMIDLPGVDLHLRLDIGTAPLPATDSYDLIRLHPIGAAAYQANIQLMQYLVVVGGVDQLKLRDGKTVLHRVCSYIPFDPLSELGNASDEEAVQCASWVLELVPELEGVADRANNYPIHLACANGGHKTVQWLVNRPMSASHLNLKNDYGKYPLDLCTDQPATTAEIIYKIDPQLLKEHQQEGNPLHAAVATGNLQIVQYVLDLIDDRCFRAKFKKKTPLMMAVEKFRERADDEAIIKSLVEKGGTEQITLPSEKTNAFTTACQHLMTPVVRYFLSVLPQCPVLQGPLLQIIKTGKSPFAGRSDCDRIELVLLLLQQEILCEDHVSQIGADTLAAVRSAFMAQRKKSAQLRTED